MPAFVILDITVTDSNLFEEYKKLAPATIEAYGGEHIARGGTAEAVGRLDTLLADGHGRQKSTWLASIRYLPYLRVNQLAATSKAENDT